MSTEWPQVRLGDLISVKHGFAFSGQYFVDEPTSDVLVTPGSFAIGGGYKQDKPKYYRGPVPSDYVLQAGDVVVTMTDLSKSADTLGYGAVVPALARTRFLHNQRIGRIEVRRPDLASLKFIHWILRTDAYRQEVLGSASGSTVKHTAPSRIEAFRFRLPPLPQQHAIARILGALDDKIELNRRTNETLEAMARAIFQSWFVDFDPVRAKMEGRQPEGMDAETAKLFPARLVEAEREAVVHPEGWQRGPVYALCAVDYGAPYASKLFNSEQRGLGVIRIRDLTSQNPDVFTEERHPRDVLVAPGDVLVGMDGEFRATVWHGPESLLNQRVCRFRPHRKQDATFLRMVIEESLAFVERTEVATTVIHLGKSDIDGFSVLLPPTPVLDAFGAACSPLAARKLQLDKEATSLAALRDTLLPRLLSGELRVPDAERAVADAL